MVDVCLNVYGKPYQTIVTLKSLLMYSSNHIDKIYLILESYQPECIDIEFIKSEVGYDKIIVFIPKYYLSVNKTDLNMFRTNIDYRMSVRYQFGLENTDKNFMCIIHNDVLFKDDIIGGFLSEIEGNLGIGQIGQCWNCPANYENKCDSDKIFTYNPSYGEVISDIMKHQCTRSFIHNHLINKDIPMPLLECRLNEWCCMVDVNQYRFSTMPNGTVPPFGSYVKVDLADEWFRQMWLLGYKFKNVDINRWCTHGYFSEINRGHPSTLDSDIYKRDEDLAKQYYYNNLK